MAQETQIKVKIDDNEALQALREMAALVGQISDGLSGLKMAPDAVPSAPSAPSAPSKTKEERDAEKLVEERKKIFVAETKATLQSLTSPQTMSSLTNRFGDMLSNLGKTIGPFGGPLFTGGGELMRMLGRSVAAREARLGDVLNLESLEAEMGGIIETRNAQRLGEDRAERLAKLGLDPMQARQFMLGAAGATGFKVTSAELSGERLAQLAAAERTGVSAQSLAQLAAAISQNTGAAVGGALDNSLILRNLAEQKLDLRGSGVERFLSRIGGFVEGLTARGITATGGAFDTLAGIRTALGPRGRGQRPMQVLESLSGVGQGVFGQISAPFQEIAQMAVYANVMSRSRSPFDAMKKAEELQRDPRNIPRIIARALGGGDEAFAALAAIPGIGTRDAPTLLGLTPEGIPTAARGAVTPAAVTDALELTGARAEQERTTIRGLRDDALDKETFKQLIKVSGEMERSTLSMTENLSVLTKLTNAQIQISQDVTSLVNKIAAALDALSRFL